MVQRDLPLKPQVYRDDRPVEYFDRFYDHACAHEPMVIYDLARLVLVPFCQIFYRATATGVEHVPGAGPVILAPNHFSAMDHFFCGMYLRRRVRFMAKSQLFHGLLAWILRTGGAFPVQRGRHDERSIATALSILTAGGIIVIYPEGGRSRSGRISEHARSGVGRLALQSGAPVIPVAIHGSAHARNWRRGRFPRVRIHYGQPLLFDRSTEVSREDAQVVAEGILRRVREIYEQLDSGGSDVQI